MGQTSLSVGAAGTQNSDLRTVMCAHADGWVESNVNPPTDESSRWATPRNSKERLQRFKAKASKLIKSFRGLKRLAHLYLYRKYRLKLHPKTSPIHFYCEIWTQEVACKTCFVFHGRQHIVCNDTSV